MTGLVLTGNEYGDAASAGAAAPPAAILHGLFGSARNWATIAQRLAAAGHRVVALDLRNHGASPWADTMDYADLAEDVCATMQARGYPRYALIGHSMGGKAAMAAALLHGERIAALVVVDIAPVAYAPRHLGYVRAMRALDLAGIRRRAEADAALAAAVPDGAERGFLLQNLVFDPPSAGAADAAGGRARWRLNLAAIDRDMAQLAGFPALPQAIPYRGPALFVAGGTSDYLRSAHDPAIRRWFPHAQITVVADAGHWLHAERPQAFLDIVEPFLAAAAAASGPMPR